MDIRAIDGILDEFWVEWSPQTNVGLPIIPTQPLHLSPALTPPLSY